MESDGQHRTEALPSSVDLGHDKITTANIMDRLYELSYDETTEIIRGLILDAERHTGKNVEDLDVSGLARSGVFYEHIRLRLENPIAAINEPVEPSVTDAGARSSATGFHEDNSQGPPHASSAGPAAISTKSNPASVSTCSACAGLPSTIIHGGTVTINYNIYNNAPPGPAEPSRSHEEKANTPIEGPEDDASDVSQSSSSFHGQENDDENIDLRPEGIEDSAEMEVDSDTKMSKIETALIYNPLLRLMESTSDRVKIAEALRKAITQVETQKYDFDQLKLVPISADSSKNLEKEFKRFASVLRDIPLPAQDRDDNTHDDYPVASDSPDVDSSNISYHLVSPNLSFNSESQPDETMVYELHVEKADRQFVGYRVFSHNRKLTDEAVRMARELNSRSEGSVITEGGMAAADEEHVSRTFGSEPSGEQSGFVEPDTNVSSFSSRMAVDSPPIVNAGNGHAGVGVRYGDESVSGGLQLQSRDNFDDSTKPESQDIPIGPQTAGTMDSNTNADMFQAGVPRQAIALPSNLPIFDPWVLPTQSPFSLPRDRSGWSSDDSFPSPNLPRRQHGRLHERPRGRTDAGGGASFIFADFERKDHPRSSNYTSATDSNNSMTASKKVQVDSSPCISHRKKTSVDSRSSAAGAIEEAAELRPGHQRSRLSSASMYGSVSCLRGRFPRGSAQNPFRCRFCLEVFTQADNVRGRNGESPCSWHPGQILGKQGEDQMWSCCGWPVRKQGTLLVLTKSGPGCKNVYHQDSKTAWNMTENRFDDPVAFEA